MKYTISGQGRVFVIRLEDGEIVQDSIERFARKMDIRSAQVQILGGIDKGSKLIVGPEKSRSKEIIPMVHTVEDMHEVVGNGTIFCNDRGVPSLHCHLACGRGEDAVVGEIREGVIVWHIMEVIITELPDTDVMRKKDPATGFELLMPYNDFD